MPKRIIHDLNRAIAEKADLEAKLKNAARAVKVYKTNCKGKRMLDAMIADMTGRVKHLTEFIKANDTPDEEDEYDDTFTNRRI